MNIIGKMQRFIRNPFMLIDYLDKRNKLNFLSDERYLKLKFRSNIGHSLNLNNPKTYNEKLQYLKLYDRNPLYTKLVDKYEVRDYIADKIGGEYLVPLLGVWNNFDDIDFNKLPNQFVIKTTHDSGGVVVCKDKEQFNIEAAREVINQSLDRNYYHHYGREWPYKDVTPRIICEKYLEESDTVDLKDYKFFCFEGEPELMFIASDRATDTKFDFYDLDFNHIEVEQHYANSSKKIKKPEGFERMIDLSRILSKDFPHVRVDFYNLNGTIYFGELTFYHFSGFKPFIPSSYDYSLGKLINLSNVGNKIK